MKLISYWSDDISDELYTMPGFAVNAIILHNTTFKGLQLRPKPGYNYLHIRVQIYKRFYMFDIRLGRIIGKL